MDDPISRQSALEEIVKLLPTVREEISDPKARELLSEDLVKQVFADSWRYQFQEDRDEFRTRLRTVVGDAIKTLKLGAANQ